MNKELIECVMNVLDNELYNHQPRDELKRLAVEVLRAVSEYAKNTTVYEFYADLDSEVRKDQL